MKCLFCAIPLCGCLFLCVSLAGYVQEMPCEVDYVFFHSIFEWDDLVFGDHIPNESYKGMADYCYFVPIMGKPHNFAFVRGYNESDGRIWWNVYLLQYEIFPKDWNTWYNRIREDSSAYSKISERWSYYYRTDWLIFYYDLDLDSEPISDQLGYGYRGIIFVYGRSETYTDLGFTSPLGTEQSWWKYGINDLYYYVQRLKK